MTKALVTGANGFIGSHLVRALLAVNIEVRCLVRPTSDLSSLAGLPVTLVTGELRDPASLPAAVAGVDVIYHLGAALMVCDRETFQAVNHQGTRNLLEAARAASPGLKRFLYVSSQAAAGPCGPDQKPLTEDAPCRPVSWYGESKRDAEEAVRSFGDKFPVTIVRPSSVYGEREMDVSQVFPAVAAGVRPLIGLRKRSLVMVYVEDLVAGFIAAAASPQAVSETFFLNHPQLCSPHGLPGAVAKAMGKSFGVPLPAPTVLLRLAAPLAELKYQFLRERPALTRDKAREVSQIAWLADPSKARAKFGWSAAYDLLHGMQPTVRAWAEQQAELRAMKREPAWVLWLKFVGAGLVLGAIVEAISALNHFYSFDPWWGAFPIVLLAFGLGLGTLAWLTRRWPDVLQFLVGTAAATLVEVLNQLHLLPVISWTFRPGWPLGIQSPWLRDLVLGAAGGVIVLLVNAILRAAYAKRLRRPA
jgi:nucleoside-diphosphate-sugar epimerase